MNSCKLCGKVFAPESIPIIGETPEEKLKKLVTRFGKHIAAKHGDTAPAFQQLLQAAMISVQNLIFFNQFEVDDAATLEDLEKSRDILRGIISPPPS